MGNADIPLTGLLQNLGLEVIPPPPITKRTIELGTKYAPEFVCLPFKVNLGNYLEAIEQGADTILMAGGMGPCRFGYYAHVQYDILREIGHDVSLVVLEPDSLVEDIRTKLACVKRQNSWLEILRQIRLSAHKAYLLDDIEERILKLRSRELKPGSCDRFMQLTRERIADVYSMRELRQLKRKLIAELHRIPLAVNRDVIKVGLVGEIYLLLEPYVNLHLEQRLGALHVEVHKSIFMGKWLKEHLFFNLSARREHREMVEAARPYLSHFVGGHGLNTVGNTVRYARQGLDGVIQMLPLTCMPEIVAQSILVEVSRDLDIPVLSLTLDEHSGAAGVQTRLEAFVDMLRFKKRKQKGVKQA